jgi:23S rRNA-/tRNA-specific pseudouridylate synthase
VQRISCSRPQKESYASSIVNTKNWLVCRSPPIRPIILLGGTCTDWSDNSLSVGCEFRCVLAHRLDAATGGLLVVAKTRTAEVGIKQSFADRTFQERYKALLVGKLEPSKRECRVPMGGKEAHTKSEVVKHVRCADPLAKDRWITVVDLSPITGRRHQLRKDMQALGCPIWGDVRMDSFQFPNPNQSTRNIDIIISVCGQSE